MSDTTEPTLYEVARFISDIRWINMSLIEATRRGDARLMMVVQLRLLDRYAGASPQLLAACRRELAEPGSVLGSVPEWVKGAAC